MHLGTSVKTSESRQHPLSHHLRKDGSALNFSPTQVILKLSSAISEKDVLRVEAFQEYAHSNLWLPLSIEPVGVLHLQWWIHEAVNGSGILLLKLKRFESWE